VKAVIPSVKALNPSVKAVIPSVKALNPSVKAVIPSARAVGGSRRRSFDAEARFLGSPTATIGAIQDPACVRERVRGAITAFHGGTIAVVSGITVTHDGLAAVVRGQMSAVDRITGFIDGTTGFAGSLGRSTRSAIRFASPMKR